MTDIIVTTCDIKQDYDILGPVYVYASNRYDAIETLIENHSSKIKCKAYPPEYFEKVFLAFVEELKKRAEKMGANAIIGLHQNMNYDVNDLYFHFYMYGTAVKLI